MGTRFKLRVCTWNVGNAQPPADLHAWLGTDTDEFDIIAVGAQEANFGSEKTQNPSSTVSPMSNSDIAAPMTTRQSSLSTPNLSLNTISTSSTSGGFRKQVSRAVRAAGTWRSSASKKAKSIVDAETNTAPENGVQEGLIDFIAGSNTDFLDSNSDEVQSSPKARASISLPLPLRGSQIGLGEGIRKRFSDDTDGSSRKGFRDDDDAVFHVPTSTFEELDDSLLVRRVQSSIASVDADVTRHPPSIGDEDFESLPEMSPVSKPRSAETDEPDLKFEVDPDTPPPETRLRRMLTGSWVRKLQSTNNPQHSPWKETLPQGNDEEVGDDAQVAVAGTKQRKFSQVIENSMPPEYQLIAKYHLMEIKLLIFVHHRHSSRVVKTERVAEATGIGNVVGNKGGVAVKLTLDDTTFCFVCSHLAAHEGPKFLQQRNDDVVEIMRHIERNKVHGLPAIHQYNHLFWMGDLNYRLDLKRVLPAAVTWSHQDRWCYVIDLIANRRYTDLAQLDELVHEMELGHVFTGFVEGRITFAPTFKVQRGKPYSSYQSLRVPSYCDRILWHSLPLHRNHIKLIEYNSVLGIETSDHKPVYAVFDLVIPLPIRIIPFPAPRDSLKCVIDFKSLRVHGLYEKRSDADDNALRYEVLSDGALAVSESTAAEHSSSRGSLLTGDSENSPSHTRRVVHADFHGGGIFVKERPYRAEVPLRAGRVRKCGYAELPKIALRPVERLGDLTYKYVTVVFTRLGSRQGSSCVLPLATLVQQQGRHEVARTLELTKYGGAIARVEIEVELVVSMETWIDARNNVVRLKK